MLLMVGINWIIEGRRGAGTQPRFSDRLFAQRDTIASYSMNSHGTAVQDSKRVKLSSIFSHLEAVPLAEVFRLKEQFSEDQSQNKIDLSVGGELLHANRVTM